jgi:hypothetical protein
MGVTIGDTSLFVENIITVSLQKAALTIKN